MTTSAPILHSFSIGEHTIHRLTFTLSHTIDPLEYLKAFSFYPKVFWKSKHLSRLRIALGSIYQTKHLPLWTRAEKDPTPLFGGKFFADLIPEHSLWNTFSSPHFFLPRVLLYLEPDHPTTLTYHYLDSERADDVAVFLTPVSKKTFSSDFPLFLQRNDLPTYEEWKVLINKGLKTFKTTPLKKVVLARACTCIYDQVLDPFAVLKHLLIDARSSTILGYMPSKTHAFVGASPESLYLREGDQLYTEAIAGTKVQGTQTSLLDDEKIQREFQYVTSSLESLLQKLCHTYTKDLTPSILSTASLEHCHLRFRGSLHPWVSDQHLIESLHPTPAIGGFPRELALDFIAHHEPWARGYYSAPLGWISSQSSELVVGIRSALIQENLLTAFAGAGIVAGSDPKQEWNELEAKISPFLNFARQSKGI